MAKRLHPAVLHLYRVVGAVLLIEHERIGRRQLLTGLPLLPHGRVLRFPGVQKPRCLVLVGLSWCSRRQAVPYPAHSSNTTAPDNRCRPAASAASIRAGAFVFVPS